MTDVIAAPHHGPVDVLDALVEHLGRPLIVNERRHDRRRYLVVFALGTHNEWGHERERDLLEQLALGLRDEVERRLDQVEEVWIDSHTGQVVALLGAGHTRGLAARIAAVYRDLANTPWHLPDGSSHRVDIGAAWSPVPDRRTPRAFSSMIHHTSRAAKESLARRDLVCLRAKRPRGERRRLPARIRLTLQIGLVGLFSIVAPYLLMRTTYALGLDTSSWFYLAVVVALGFTAVMIWTEALHALTPPELPEEPTGPAPVATAIVAAYLPNEAGTILETLRHTLGQDYPGELQVILAYNSPVDLAIEDDLAALAEHYPELELLKVADSTSKAQNVNAALQIARGEFIGVFDADHHPMPGAFSRAWRWLADGADVVQGHCVVRNGDESLIARTVAVEFEQIYAVSHPGRASLHGFGIFGGSNGFWRASVLRQMRMRVDRLTEDIDVSIRSVLAGRTIVSDPGLISRELAPTSLRALWRQRMRWAQGWFQVSLRQLPWVPANENLSRRQRTGMLVLLSWREVYPWISPMIVSVLAFLWWRDGSVSFNSPLFLLTTLYTFASGPVQILFAWRLSAPEIRRRWTWFAWYVVVAGPIYNEWKNLIARVAQIKELSGEHVWHVTPRGTLPHHVSGSVSAPTDAAGLDRPATAGLAA